MKSGVEQSKKTAIIIGSGIAGMAAASRLSTQGFVVKVFEKNAVPGGKLSMFEQDGYRFDAGPSLFTQPANMEELFAAAGEPIQDYFNYKRMEVACTYFFESGKVVKGYANPISFAKELKEKTGEDLIAVRKYLSAAKNLYEFVGKIFLNHSLHKRSTWLHRRLFKALSTVRMPYLFSSLHRYNKSKFKTAEAVQIFNRFATYNGSNPFKAPAMLSVIPHLEFNQGTFYPAGGMISITNALQQLALRQGVKFYFNTPVQRIIHHSGKALGVVVNNENIMADVVVSNSDIYFTYKHLLNHDHKAKRLLRQERSSSALIFYWGIGKSFSQLGLHNIFFSKDYKKEFDQIFKKGSVTDDPTVYINITAKEEAEHAPDGKENWFVMVNVPANTGQDWEGLKVATRANVLAKLSRMLGEDISALIETEETLDPVSIEAQTSSFRGALYGTSSNSKMAAFFRTPNFTHNIKNLYHCGGSVHPGGGIPLCLKSARITANLIKEDFSKRPSASH